MTPRRIPTLALALGLCLGPLAAPAAAAAAKKDAGPAAERARAHALLKRVDDLWRGKSSYARMRMVVKTAHYQRTLRMEAWSKGKQDTLVRILAPARERGTATLKAGEAIYTYLPHTDRTIKLNAGMMGGSWMGSHFTNDDLVHESRMSDDYNARITWEGVRDGRKEVQLTLIPKPDAAVVWGKIVTLLDDSTLNPIRSVYYDEDQQPVRTMTFSDVKRMAGRLLPATLRLVPADKPKEYTEMTYESLKLDLPLRASLFSLQNLRRR